MKKKLMSKLAKIKKIKTSLKRVKAENEFAFRLTLFLAWPISGLIGGAILQSFWGFSAGLLANLIAGPIFFIVGMFVLLLRGVRWFYGAVNVYNLFGALISILLIALLIAAIGYALHWVLNPLFKKKKTK